MNNSWYKNLRYMKLSKLKLQTGETIVEVMLSVVILSFTMVTIFAIARQSLSTGQAANERSQVQAMVETQLERMKYLSERGEPIPDDLNIFRDGEEFCITENLEVVTGSGLDFPGSCYDDSFASNSGLRIAVTYDRDGPNDGDNIYDDDTFTVTATWTRVNDSTTERLVKNYRLHNQPPPADPELDCGEGSVFDINSSLTTDEFAFDVDFQWWQPLTSPPGGNNVESRIGHEVTAVSEVYIDARCVYEADFTMWCTAPRRDTPLGPLREPVLSECGINNQPDESMRIRMWDTYDSATSQCSGSQLAFFDALDPLAGQPNQVEFDGTSRVADDVANILSNGIVRCLDAIHVCALNEYATSCNNRSSRSSVHLKQVTWSVRS